MDGMYTHVYIGMDGMYTHVYIGRDGLYTHVIYNISATMRGCVAHS